MGIIVGCCVFSLSFCSPSFVASRAFSDVSICGVVISILVCVLKSLTVLLPRSMLTIGNLPPLCFSNCSCRSLDVLLCRDMRRLAMCMHPPRRWVLVRGWLHLVQSIGPWLICFFLHL